MWGFSHRCSGMNVRCCKCNSHFTWIDSYTARFVWAFNAKKQMMKKKKKNKLISIPIVITFFLVSNGVVSIKSAITTTEYCITDIKFVKCGH